MDISGELEKVVRLLLSAVPDETLATGARLSRLDAEKLNAAVVAAKPVIALIDALMSDQITILTGTDNRFHLFDAVKKQAFPLESFPTYGDAVTARHHILTAKIGAVSVG